ncbi:hypothetical protein BC832DRAFT_552510 [Gaertneriomyces semiglobifer]|nr:hypothetical protein BC832DRAFT_552510 [Gaertneriomyces semiglobifer]
MRSLAFLTVGLVLAVFTRSTDAQQQHPNATKCYYVNANSLCGPEFVGYPMARGPAIASQQQLDAYISSSVQNHNDIQQFLIRSNKCASPPSVDLVAAVDQLQYYTSLWCAITAVDSVEFYKCPIQENASPNVKPHHLCPDHCQQAVDAWKNTMQLSECTFSEKSVWNQRFAAFSSYCAAQAKLNDPQCFRGTAAEVQNCGYLTEDLARKYCPTSESACCQELLKGKPSIVKPILGVAVALVVALACGIVACLVCKRRRKAALQRSMTARDRGYPSQPAAVSYQSSKSWEHQQDATYWNGPTAANTTHIEKPMQAMTSAPYAYSHDIDIPLSPMSSPPHTLHDSNLNHTPWQTPVVTDTRIPPSPTNTATSTNVNADLPLDTPISIPMLVTHPYNATLQDELELQFGMEVRVVRAFDDGWAIGIYEGDNEPKGGAFPLVCVVRKPESAAQAMPEPAPPASHQNVERLRKSVSRRVSSQRYDRMSFHDSWSQGQSRMSMYTGATMTSAADTNMSMTTASTGMGWNAPFKIPPPPSSPPPVSPLPVFPVASTPPLYHSSMLEPSPWTTTTEPATHTENAVPPAPTTTAMTVNTTMMPMTTTTAMDSMSPISPTSSVTTTASGGLTLVPPKRARVPPNESERLVSPTTATTAAYDIDPSAVTLLDSPMSSNDPMDARNPFRTDLDSVSPFADHHAIENVMTPASMDRGYLKNVSEPEYGFEQVDGPFGGMDSEMHSGHDIPQRGDGAATTMSSADTNNNATTESSSTSAAATTDQKPTFLLSTLPEVRFSGLNFDMDVTKSKE